MTRLFATETYVIVCRCTALAYPKTSRGHYLEDKDRQAWTGSQRRALRFHSRNAARAARREARAHGAIDARVLRLGPRRVTLGYVLRDTQAPAGDARRYIAQWVGLGKGPHLDERARAVHFATRRSARAFRAENLKRGRYVRVRIVARPGVHIVRRLTCHELPWKEYLRVQTVLVEPELVLSHDQRNALRFASAEAALVFGRAAERLAELSPPMTTVVRLVPKKQTEAQPACATCSKPATCYGRYEDMPEPAYACDECCGHGCEDGRCEPLPLGQEATP